MPKIIIPNAYEIYKTGAAPLTPSEIRARQFYNFRFIWLLEEGDVILLPEMPAPGFLDYLAGIKNINPEKIYPQILGGQHASLTSAALSDADLCARLKTIVRQPSEWRIQACCFNARVAEFADMLAIPIDRAWREFIEQNNVRLLNSKSVFRTLAEINDVPIPEGDICLDAASFRKSLMRLIRLTGRVIVKQDFNAGGRGNIGISLRDEALTGTARTIHIKNMKQLHHRAAGIWAECVDTGDQQLVLEAYYPNKGSFTAQYHIPPQGQRPELLNYSEIRMEQRWIGVQIPAPLTQEQTDRLLLHSLRLARLLQNFGYQGYICCDAILTHEHDLLFTEINVRPGAETHAYILTRELLQNTERVVLTRHGMKIPAFAEAYRILKESGLMFDPVRQTGVIILTVDKYENTMEYFIAGMDKAHALEMEEWMLRLY